MKPKPPAVAEIHPEYDEFDPLKEPRVEELWLEEARRRYDNDRRGEMKAVPGDEPMARARSRLR
jgi:putative addiction module component